MNAAGATPIEAAIEIINTGLAIAPLGEGKRALIYIAPIDAVSPLTVPEARRLWFASSLAELLSQCGYKVHCHSLFCEDTEALNRLAVSVWLRYLELCGEQLPYLEGCYQGDYIFDFAATVHRTYGDRWRVAAGEVLATLSSTQTSIPDFYQQMRVWLGEPALATITEIGRQSISRDIVNDLREINITFDQWPSATSLSNPAKTVDWLQRLDARGLVHIAGGSCYLHLPGVPKAVLQNSSGPTALLVQLCDYLTLLERDSRDDDLNIVIYDNDFKQSLSLFQSCSQSLGYPLVSWVEKVISPTRLFELGEVVLTSPLDEDFASFREVRHSIGWKSLRGLFASIHSSGVLNVDLNGVTTAKTSGEKPDCSDLMQNTASDAGDKLDANAFHAAMQGLNSSQRHRAERFLELISEYPAMVEQARQRLEPAGLILYYRKLCETVLSYYNNHQFKVSNHHQGETIPVESIQGATVIITTMAIAIRRLSAAIDKLSDSQLHLN